MEPEGDVLAVQVLQGRKQDGAMASGQVLQGRKRKGALDVARGGGWGEAQGVFGCRMGCNMHMDE
jgi:hypothetical protein